MPIISVSGTQGIGKTTFIEDFLAQWPMYKTPDKSYRDIIKSKKLKINKEVTKEGQRLILDSIIESMNAHDNSEFIILDRCPLDNLVYSLWAFEHEIGDIDEEFIADCITVVRSALQKIDLMLMIPITEHNDVALEEDGVRDVDPTYQKEINTLFQELKTLRDNADDVFFVKGDCSPIIEIFGDRSERTQITGLYIRTDGLFYGDEDSLLNDEDDVV